MWLKDEMELMLIVFEMELHCEMDVLLQMKALSECSIVEVVGV